MKDATHLGLAQIKIALMFPVSLHFGHLTPSFQSLFSMYFRAASSSGNNSKSLKVLIVLRDIFASRSLSNLFLE
jgi:hypothetical protein